MVRQGLKGVALTISKITKKYQDIFPLAKVILEWPTIVGKDLASTVVPEKITQYKGENILYLCVHHTSAKVLIQHQLPIIEARVNTLFGAGFISRIVLKRAVHVYPIYKPVKKDVVDDLTVELALDRLEKALDA